jgi:hypothetical protein
MRKLTLLPLALSVLAACAEGPTSTASPPDGAAGLNISGAIYTTASGCTGVNVNIFQHKDSVYLDGGPQTANSQGLPEGAYFVQVTTPEGTLLGYSPTAVALVEADGRFAECYHLSEILLRASDDTPGYDDTDNGGGEYKVWISTGPDFVNNASKTDNFKVAAPPPPPPTWLHVRKYYDANANGAWDAGEVSILGWRISINGVFASTEYDSEVDPGSYTVAESMPIETGWMAINAAPATLTLAAGDVGNVAFGNLCTGAGGGLTLGFWSNKNGQALVGAGDLAMLTALNLRNASGGNADFTAYNPFRSWILNATATNMAYMLSAQLAAMELNVYNGNVNGGSLIYAPGTTSANGYGFATVSAVMAEANASLGTDPVTVASGAARSYQEALKNALDNGNNNRNFVQAGPCAFSFPALP